MAIFNVELPKGTTLPAPAGYDEPAGVYGAGVEMLDGSIHYDIIDSTRKAFVLVYRNINYIQKLQVDAGLQAALSPVVFVTPMGFEYTVQVDAPSARLRWQSSTTGRDLRWSATITLREVS